MTPTIATDSPELAEIAGVLAKAYLRLTGNGETGGFSWDGEPPNCLDVTRTESKPVSTNGRSTWTPA